MLPEIFSRKNPKVISVSKVKIKGKVNPEYKIYSDEPTTSTGLVQVIKLLSQNRDLPYFIFRWDEKAENLDVDIYNVSNEGKEKFKKGVNGFSGHHFHITEENSKRRVWKGKITIPGREIFEGEIIFALKWQATFQTKASIKPILQIKVIRKNNSSPE